MSEKSPCIRWFTPDKPDNISVGRQRIATHLRKEGFIVDVVGTTVANIRAALRERDQYDIIIGTTRAGGLAGTLIGRITGKPVIVDHIDPISQFRQTHWLLLSFLVNMGENLSFAAANAVLYVYEDERPRVARYSNKTLKTDLGVDYERFANPDPDIVETVENQLSNLGVNENLAIYIGGLEPIYHVEELLAALPHLRGWSLIVIGDGTLRSMVAAKADKEESIHYLGTVPHRNIPGFLQVSDVGVSLVDDPHTLKVLEYGAAGLPVVQASGQAEDRFGDLVEYCDLHPDSIADAIEKARDNKPNKALQSFSSNFDWREITKDYIEAIELVS